MSQIAKSFDFSRVAADRRTQFNPIPQLRPEELSRQIDAFRSGSLRDLALTMDAIEERDDLLASVVPKAKAAPGRHGWEVLTVDTANPADKTLAAQQKAALEWFYNNVRARSASDQDEIGGLRLLLKQMMDAKGKRYSVHNMVWRYDGPGRYSAEAWHVPLWYFEARTGRLRYIDTPYGYDGADLAPGAWLVTVGAGLLIPCAVAWMYKRLPLRDWLVYCTRHGLPGIEGVCDAPEGSEEWQKVVQAVRSAATDFRWVRSSGCEIKTIDFSASGELPFPALIERMDRSMTAIWRGADLSTMSAGSGAGDGASLQGKESEVIEADDAQWLSETLNYRLDRLVLDYVFGVGTPALAYVKILTAQHSDTRMDLEIDRFALDNGHPISRKQFAERYNRPLPDAADQLLIKSTVSTQSTASTPAINEAGPAQKAAFLKALESAIAAGLTAEELDALLTTALRKEFLPS